jgi:ATP-dependent helicase/nuclease subunit B
VEEKDQLFLWNLSRVESLLHSLISHMAQDLATCLFEAKGFEYKIDKDGDMPPITLPLENGGNLIIHGIVDRVDTYEKDGVTYFRIVDYKTGGKDFVLDDIYYGIGLQMLLYLFTLEDKGEPILGAHAVPAGVQYFPARVPVLSADGRLSDEEAVQAREKEWKRKGLLLADNEVLRAMEPEDAPHRLSCKWNKSGELTGDVADRQQLKMLKAYLFRILGRMTDDIAAGNVEANPYTRGTSHNACTYCPYGAVCSKADVKGRRNYQSMSSDKFWEEIGKEMKENG